MRRLVAACVLVGLALPASARGDDYFDKETDAGEMTFRVPRPRSRGAWILIGSLGGAAALVGGTGVLFHLSGNSQTDKVEAPGPTGLIWTRERQDTFDSAVFRRRVAFTAYGVASGLLIATVVAFIQTDPGTKLIRVGTEKADRTDIRLLPGGGLVTREWSF